MNPKMASAQTLKAALTAIADELDAASNKSSPGLTLEEQLDALRKVGELYAQRGTQFQVGQLVTPRANSNLRGGGKPHLIIELMPSAAPVFEVGERVGPGSSRWGECPQIRVFAVGGDGDVVPYWSEAWRYEEWTPPSSTPTTEGKPEPTEKPADPA